MTQSGRTIATLIFSLLIFLFVSCNTKSETDKKSELTTITTQEAIAQMARGINIGNTLEPPDEGGWNNGTLQKYYFEDYKNAGFTSIRIPVKWGTHTSENAPFQIDGEWIDRVEQVVDWGLEQDLFIVINAHHDDWLKQDFSPINVARFDSIWSQIAIRFKDKSPKLLFEIFNEPIGLTKEQVDEINAKVLATIRKTNPTRIVLYSGRDYSGLDFLKETAIPDDPYIMGYFHSYDPWSFAGEGNGIWGTDSERNSIESLFQSAALWSQQNNIPVLINEFGAVKSCDYNSRMLHYFTYVESAIKYHVGFQVWDDGGDFGIYERDSRTWPEVKDILIYTYPESPNNLTATIDGNPKFVVLSWKNRTSDNTSIIIQRKTENGDFADLVELEKDKNMYMDNTVENNQTYYYRIIAKFESDENNYSYPIKIMIY